MAKRIELKGLTLEEVIKLSLKVGDTPVYACRQQDMSNGPKYDIEEDEKSSYFVDIKIPQSNRFMKKTYTVRNAKFINGELVTTEKNSNVVKYHEYEEVKESLTKSVFCLDVETDGLYGEAFSVAAVALKVFGQKVVSKETFNGYAELDGVQNEWVKENALPKVTGQEYETKKAMRDAFWNFYEENKGDYVVADFGAPVEAAFFKACIMDDLEVRQWKGPYPLHEVGTLLLANGYDPDAKRSELEFIEGEEFEGLEHNALADCILSAMVFVSLLFK